MERRISNLPRPKCDHVMCSVSVRVLFSVSPIFCCFFLFCSCGVGELHICISEVDVGVDVGIIKLVCTKELILFVVYLLSI